MFASKLAALADANGGALFDGLTVEYLITHCRYGFDNRRYSKRTIQYWMRALERVGFLEIIRPARFGSGRKQRYQLHPGALATVEKADPILRPPHRRPGWQSGQNAPKSAPLHLSTPPVAPIPPPRPPLKRRWDPPQDPSELFSVASACTHELFNAKYRAGERAISYTEMAALMKDEFAPKWKWPDSAFIYKVLDSVIVSRKRQGLSLPVDITGTPGHSACRRGGVQ